jgi:hypothetical protein
MFNSTGVPLALRGEDERVYEMPRPVEAIILSYPVLFFTENFFSFDKEYDALAEYLALPGNLTEILGWSDSQNTFTDEILTKIVRR